MISEFVEYVKQEWKNKPIVSSPLNAERMNHIEDGIENNSKKIKETVTQVNALMKNPIMATWGGQFAYDDSVISSPAWARCIKYANGKCDIHIDTMIETNKATGNFYKIWDKTRMLSGFGINTLSFKPYQTRVSVERLVGGTQDYFGRTGLAFQSEEDFFLLSRAYDTNLQTFGGWGIEAAPLYAVGTVHHIDIWGADYT